MVVAHQKLARNLDAVLHLQLELDHRRGKY